MNKHIVLITALIAFSNCSLTGQSAYYQQGHDIYHSYDRFDILYTPTTTIQTSAKYYSRNAIIDFLKGNSQLKLGVKDKSARSYFLRDTLLSKPTENLSLLKHVYRNPSHLFEYNSKDFSFVINPILNFNIGQDFSNDEFIFQNTRGLELYGSLDQKIYFSSAFYENQSNFLSYIKPFVEQYKAIPGQGNYKDYQSGIVSSFKGYDYSNAIAYLGYQISKHSILELGHGKHFIGNGVRSLLLSDSGHNYLYLKFRVAVWKIYYQSIFAELTSGSGRFVPNNILLPKKYMASHYLGIKLNPKLEVGLFESVVFSRENQFELQYLNPVILYRTIEHQLDSPDNVLLGLNIKWNLFNRMSLYGQLLLDELKFDEIFAGTGWWGNKYGIQLGLKYLNLGNIDHLDIQIEYNLVRPYTYSHWNSTEEFPILSVGSYAHYNQALAHPLGANFSEILALIKYKFNPKLYLELGYLYTKVGKDSQNNYGSDILLNNNSRVSDFGISLHQGEKSNISQFSSRLSFEIMRQLNFDVNLIFRRDSNKKFGTLDTKYFSAGIRYNVGFARIDYK